MINILLVEDHILVRDGICLLLADEPDLCIKATASCAAEAQAVIQSQPEINMVVTDINMPDKDGIELVRDLKQEFPEVKMVILSMLDHQDYVYKAFAAGVLGYLLKTIPTTEFVFALRHVAAGYTYLASSLSRLLIKQPSAFYIPNEKEFKCEHLTERESEVLKYVARGMTNNQIADKLFSSRRTIEGHRQKLLNKTGTINTADLIRFAIQYNIIR
ncbi:response regulator transcription factor [Hufsiella ginkgonis]|uniref:Response regulator n=1 Tax=Hufsiella ginkgonis TaxID=2695274 RepID=A0A7K1Y1R1_9SPHI|nr:response regulator transcription factor [Hufsiella ginkgonis]MXV16626.1 response regulator [Hufsiella ginkgonis]